MLHSIKFTGLEKVRFILLVSFIMQFGLSGLRVALLAGDYSDVLYSASGYSDNNQYPYIDNEPGFSETDNPYLVKDINTQFGQVNSEPRDITEVNGIVYFSAFTPDYGRELWKSDGTSEGTLFVKDVEPGLDSSSIDRKSVV